MGQPRRHGRNRIMSTYYWGFWYALIFLSRVPGPYLQRVDKEVQQAAMWFYPIVGAILGVFLVSLVLLCYLYNPQASFLDRKSTRLNSSHVRISYAVFCLKKKNKQ